MLKMKELGFEESLISLEKIVRQLESGDLPLERALEIFEEGIGLARRCQAQLAEAERKVEMLLRERGELKLVPFDSKNASPASDFEKSSAARLAVVSSNPVETLDLEDVTENKTNDQIPF